MRRNATLLQNLDLSVHTGIEIGALANPIVPPSDRVFYVDHLDTPGLVHKYRKDPSIDVSKIVQVGGVWGEQSLAQAAAGVAPVDYIVASHVIEHVPNLVGWLAELASVLKDAGEVRLAVPDRRHTFDFARRETQLPEVLEAHITGARRPSAGRVLDFAVNFREVDCLRSWREPPDPERLKHAYDVPKALQLAREVIDNGAYHDVHCWVFTPASFAQLMEQMARLGLSQFRCSFLEDTQPDTLEFLVGLQRCPDPEVAADSWAKPARSLRDAERETARQADPSWVEAQRKIQQLTEVQEHARRLEQQLEDLRASTSWRITAPLRRLGSLLR